MVFSSFEFLFIYLPLFMLGYFCIKNEYRNTYIFFLSICFYFIGEQKQTWILLASVVINFSFAWLISRCSEKEAKEHWRKKLYLWICILLNLSLLGYFKYANFFIENTNKLLDQPLELAYIGLPLGISFYTFQAISYVVDIYRGDIKAPKSIITFGAAQTMFPHLVAGPIVRYSQIAQELAHRTVDLAQFSKGIILLCLGLGAKVLIADVSGAIADPIFSLPLDEITFAHAWLGSIAYSIQIFFDFWGYTMMAVGMGLMLGFHFPPNFNYPYTAKTIQEFWRRWHMTLSFWFRDYVYIPLGGSHVRPWRVYLNLLIVFLLTGFWHGASWTFIFWGLWHGLFIMLERYFSEIVKKTPGFLLHLYALFVVLLGWIFFRSSSVDQAKVFIIKLFDLRSINTESLTSITEFLNIYNGLTLVLALIICTGIFSTDISNKRSKTSSWTRGLQYAPALMLFIVLLAANQFVTLYHGAAMVFVLFATKNLFFSSSQNQINSSLGVALFKYALILALFGIIMIKILSGAPSAFLYFRF